ncbi:MAG: hypothetical protein V4684_02640 [Pseudomonadota bacterium]
MTRNTVRSHKRALREGTRPEATGADRLLSSESALALLDRSIRFGHGRLAVLRLVVAVDAGARIPEQHWAYCLRLSQGGMDRRLNELYLSAAVKASGGADSAEVPPRVVDL